MQVGRIGDKYEERFPSYNPGALKKKLSPLQAVAFDRIDLSSPQQGASDISWLRKFILDMPDETVKERMRQVFDACPEFEEVLSEKLIMEEL